MVVWNVYYHNINADRIETFNVFRHGGLVADIASLVKKRKNKEEFAEGLRRSVLYYYWCKSEWEVLIYPWCGSRDNKPIKVDVYSQIMNNWDIFLEYTWKHRKDLTFGDI